MSRLDKGPHRLNRGSDLISDAPQHRRYPFPIGWRSFPERYIDGEQGVHVHVWGDREQGSGFADAPEFCAVLPSATAPATTQEGSR